MTNGKYPHIIADDMNRPANPILQDIEAFLSATGMTKTEFGLSALNDGKLIDNLRDGRRIWPETEKKIRDFIKSHRAPEARAESGQVTPAPTPA